jgi:hypothetical protein
MKEPADANNPPNDVLRTLAVLVISLFILRLIFSSQN